MGLLCIPFEDVSFQSDLHLHLPGILLIPLSKAIFIVLTFLTRRFLVDMFFKFEFHTHLWSQPMINLQNVMFFC